MVVEEILLCKLKVNSFGVIDMFIILYRIFLICMNVIFKD